MMVIVTAATIMRIAALGMASWRRPGDQPALCTGAPQGASRQYGRPFLCVSKTGVVVLRRLFIHVAFQSEERTGGLIIAAQLSAALESCAPCRKRVNADANIRWNARGFTQSQFASLLFAISSAIDCARLPQGGLFVMNDSVSFNLFHLQVR